MDEDTRKGTIKLWHKIKHDDYAVSEFYHVIRNAVQDMLLIGGCTVFGFGFGWLSRTHWEHKWVDKWYAGHPLNGLRLSPPDPLIVTSKRYVTCDKGVDKIIPQDRAGQVLLLNRQRCDLFIPPPEAYFMFKTCAQGQGDVILEPEKMRTINESTALILRPGDCAMVTSNNEDYRADMYTVHEERDGRVRNDGVGWGSQDKLKKYADGKVQP